MKARIPKAFNELTRADQARVNKYMQDIATTAALEQINKDCRIMLDLYIKMVCVVLHDAFGFGERRLIRFLGNHKLLFTRQARMVKDGTQIEYLEKRMAEIFPKDGFPKDFFDNMLGEVERNDTRA